ncbi:probable disease resistance protein At4g19060 isoform X2 [Malania oleifera]|uniref:probable disease resistance protein At4g19060 isoform X2 n=1 Tax=Malania oleifera TaxID=397392 RepID=UPI0025AE5D5F|nr:probable disease resistance protein At4g19060 isoform X2 [Malania oleifera]
MASDIIQFYKNKFLYEFQDAAEECGEFPWRSSFHAIADILQETKIGSSTSLQVRDWIIDLSFALQGCRNVAEEEERRAQSKKSSSTTSSHCPLTREFFFLCKTKRKLRRIKEKLQGVRDVAAAREAESSSSSGSNLVRVLTDFSNFEPSKIHGFTDQIWKIEKWLLETSDEEQGINAIGIVGMGGSGKSTIAQMVFQSEVIRKRFSPMIWVWLSERLNPENIDSRVTIVKQIVEYLTPDDEIMLESDLAKLLHILFNRLSDKKYLIVFDNVYHSSDWYFNLGCGSQVASTHSLSSGLPKGGGGAIIVNSRLEEVASGMVGEHRLHHVQPILDEESCWSIIMDSIEKLDLIGLDDPVLLNMKDEIVDKCSGLPLAAKILGKIISARIEKDLAPQGSTGMMAVFRVAFSGDKQKKKKAMKEVSSLAGVLSISADIKTNKLVVIGRFDPVMVLARVRKYFLIELIYVGPPVTMFKKKRETEERRAQERGLE